MLIFIVIFTTENYFADDQANIALTDVLDHAAAITILPRTDHESTDIESIDGALNITSDSLETNRTMDALAEHFVEYRDTFESVNKKRSTIYVIVFAVSLCPFIFAIAGGITKKKCCWTWSYCLFWLSFWAIWVILAVHAPVTVAISDLCDYAEPYIDTPEHTTLYDALCIEGLGVMARLAGGLLMVAIAANVACCFSVKLVRKSRWNSDQHSEWDPWIEQAKDDIKESNKW